MTIQCEFLELAAWETQWPFWGELAVCLRGAPRRLDLCGRHSRDTTEPCCQVNHASSGRALQSSALALLPSNARFHFRKQCLKGWAQKARPRADRTPDRRNWINPVLPNCTIWYLKSQLFQFLQKSVHCFVSQPNWRQTFSFQWTNYLEAKEAMNGVHLIWCSNYQSSIKWIWMNKKQKPC